MNPFEFISFTKCQGEKYLGIATVKLYGKLILRYKIILTKDGVNFFAAPASYKINDAEGERYVPAFLLDSVSDNEALMALIKKSVASELSGRTAYPAPATTPSFAGFQMPPMPSDNVPF